MPEKVGDSIGVKMSDTKYKPQESVADFRARLAIMMRERDTGKRYSVIGAAPANECVVRRYGQPSFLNAIHDDGSPVYPIENS